MAEVCTPPVITYDSKGNELVTFTVDHSWGDVGRWIAKNPADLEEIIYILIQMELENSRLQESERVCYAEDFIGCFDE
jgi:hypothetical protein